MQQSMFEEVKKTPPKSIFKSACQKNIRRGNLDSALRCAKANIEQDAYDFSRRVMILAPEDATIHPLMVQMVEINSRLSKKGSVATDNDKDIMLTIVRDITLAKVRDSWEYQEESSFKLTEDMFKYLSTQKQNILKALKYRGSLGGMWGDVKMCNAMINHLAEKWINGERYEYDMFYTTLDQPLVDNRTISEPTENDIPFFAIDFHCFPPIAKLCLFKPVWNDGIKSYLPTEYKHFIDAHKSMLKERVIPPKKGISEDEEWVRKVMWLYESSINYKKDYNTGKVVDERAELCEQDRKIFDQAHQVLLPIWKDVADWYLGQYYKD